MKIFATRVWGTRFERVPIATFGSRGHRDRLLRLAQEDDRLLFVGTKTERTSQEFRGKLLAMAEIGAEPLETADFVALTDLDKRDIDRQGAYRFPYAVSLTKLWRFSPRPRLEDCLSKQLTMLATPGVEELAIQDVRRILALPVEPVAVPTLSSIVEKKGLTEFLRPSTGPRPTDAKFEVERKSKGDTFTYALRFGKRDIFKVGMSENVETRTTAINKHIPIEVLNERWSVHLKRRWDDPRQAFNMEQEVFRRLKTKRTGFERVRCSDVELSEAWEAASELVATAFKLS